MTPEFGNSTMDFPVMRYQLNLGGFAMETKDSVSYLTILATLHLRARIRLEDIFQKKLPKGTEDKSRDKSRERRKGDVQAA